jgi:hypothetical protein
MALVEEAARDEGAIRHLAGLLLQTARWRFIRRGLISELKRMAFHGQEV